MHWQKSSFLIGSSTRVLIKSLWQDGREKVVAEWIWIHAVILFLPWKWKNLWTQCTEYYMNCVLATIPLPLCIAVLEQRRRSLFWENLTKNQKKSCTTQICPAAIINVFGKVEKSTLFSDEEEGKEYWVKSARCYCRCMCSWQSAGQKGVQHLKKDHTTASHWAGNLPINTP